MWWLLRVQIWLPPTTQILKCLLDFIVQWKSRNGSLESFLYFTHTSSFSCSILNLLSTSYTNSPHHIQLVAGYFPKPMTFPFSHLCMRLTILWHYLFSTLSLRHILKIFFSPPPPISPIFIYLFFSSPGTTSQLWSCKLEKVTWSSQSQVGQAISKDFFKILGKQSLGIGKVLFLQSRTVNMKSTSNGV